MADETQNKVISKNNTGFPGYLDFGKLRSEAIEYIGKLSGKIWTDHNVHDPGITILETLIYAVLDLGYRTNLPAVDLFARNPEDKTPDNNFFLPSRILGNNPLTITDLRKMLVDIEGVKNAWLEVDEDTPVNFCHVTTQAPAVGYTYSTTYNPNYNPQHTTDPCECDNINGLYHVYVQLEDSLDKDKAEDLEAIKKVKQALMSHRNLCEDYIDIKILCNLEIGICADIELEMDADGEEVYLLIISALREFLSPSPRFYTFRQLAEKGRTVDEIFAGRSYDLTESHGFVDTEEFEQMGLKRVINLSDVYHLLFDLKGVRSVRNLGWMKCCKEDGEMSVPDWQLHLPENYIPRFSSSCSGFKFSRTGLPVDVDIRKFDSLLALNLSDHPKGLYELPSPYLEPELPKGIYRPDLAEYFSIQNEFPKVYGISEGGLASDVSVDRKAKARQLQGFLLFFDQLLANYLMQLKNMRSLFALSSSTEKENNHTYFINRLTDAPHFTELIRFATSEGLTGNEGTILAYPTSRKKLEEYIRKDKLKCTGPGRGCNDNCPDLPEYTFCFATERDQAVIQLREDLSFGDFDPVIVSNIDECYFFYFFTSSIDFVMISKDYYGNEQEARNAAASFKYAASIDNNYRKYMTADCCSCEQEGFSFDVELNLTTYASYLQQLVEDEELYLSRRQDFLTHLLSRFAERFTDYALLSSGYITGKDLKTGLIKAEERFLANYEDISSKRGKGYDYALDGWNSLNTSGLEKRFKGLTGIENMERHYLCHFEVEPADEQYRILIELFDQVFTVEDKIFDKSAALASLKSLYAKLLNNPEFETAPAVGEKEWRVFLRDDLGNRYLLQRRLRGEEKANTLKNNLQAAFRIRPAREENVFVGTEIFKVQVKDRAGAVIAESKDKFSSRDKAAAFVSKTGNDLSGYLADTKLFTRPVRKDPPAKLLLRTKTENASDFINEDEFVFKHSDVYHLKEVKKKFTVVNKGATVQFDSLTGYDNLKTAKEEFRDLLTRMHDIQNYAVEEDKDEGIYKLYIKDDKQKKAIYFETAETPEAGWQKVKDIINSVEEHSYQMVVSGPVPETWEFNYRSVSMEGDEKIFKSNASYKSEEAAWKAAQELYDHSDQLESKPVAGGLQLALNKKGTGVQVFAPIDDKNELGKADETIRSFAKTFRDLKSAAEDDFDTILKNSKINPDENFIYKLVDKDNPVAYYPLPHILLTKANAEAKKTELINRAQAGYNYIDIILAGEEILREKKDPETKTKRYHYLIKCNNWFYKDETKGKIKLILFESIQGYASKEEAQKAFDENYLLVLKKGRSSSNYGVNQPISLVEIRRCKPDACNSNPSIVFVPKETVVNFGSYEVQRDIIPLVKSYPIRLIATGRYKFVLGYVDATQKCITIDWCSKEVFKTAWEAMSQFQFLLMLLKYKGNFYSVKDTTDCSYHLYIREVLAVSAHGFEFPEQAWGAEGVEQFICVAQSEKGFHNYWNRKNCSYSFYAACGNMGLVHPCNYETPHRRDRVLGELFGARHFNFLQLVAAVAADHIILKEYTSDSTAVPGEIVEIYTQGTKDIILTPCEWLIKFVEAVNDSANYKKENNDWVLRYKYKRPNERDWTYYTLAKSLRPEMDQEEWKTELIKIASYFPIGLKDGKYYIDIKLPEFYCHDNPELPDSPCTPCKDELDCCVTCYTAWRSECCFDTCCEALEWYAYAWTLLQYEEHYKPVYDCCCGSYRVELHPQLSQESKAKLGKAVEEALKEVWVLCQRRQLQYGTYKSNLFVDGYGELSCLSEIVAINPQQYTNEQMACDAVERAKGLINSEGLHVVEHILLRPRCKNDNGEYIECDCDALPGPCLPGPNDTNKVCHFKWVPGGDPEPCEKEKTICFTPGCDPYSFIVTLALPAWPQRFRTPAGRQIVEKLLRKEAPAHIMLRILWLNPRDLCCFEHYYKEWIEWLGNKYCAPYSNCEFLELLFKKRFDSLSECVECKPCSSVTDPPSDCFDIETQPCSDFSLYDQINKLFCWSTTTWTSADQGKYKNCEPCSSKQETTVILKKEKKKEEEEERSVEYLKEKAGVIRARANGYSTRISKIKKNYPANKVVADAETFLTKKPEPRGYQELVTRILKENPGNKPTGLDKKAKGELIKSVTWKYLDLVCFNGKEMDKISALSDTFKLLRENNVDMHKLFKEWESEEVVKYEPLTDHDRIREILTGH